MVITHLNLSLAICCGLGHGLGLCHDLLHGHHIGIGHAPIPSMSRYLYVYV
jgi:hypothetical protein